MFTVIMDKDLKLIETMLWEKGGIFLEGLHMERLTKSADYFAFPCDMDLIKRQLRQYEDEIPAGERRKIRLLLSSSGNIEISVSGLAPEPQEPVRICFSEKTTDSNDTFLRHKTTSRRLYDSELELCRSRGFFETVFMNEKAQVTEGAVTNVIIEKNGEFYTPPIECGVLPGVYREYLLRSGVLPVPEKILSREDLEKADRIFICNSVIKLLEARLAG